MTTETINIKLLVKSAAAKKKLGDNIKRLDAMAMKATRVTDRFNQMDKSIKQSQG